MRLTSISLYSNNVEAVTFSLQDSDPTARYQVRNMIGLDAEEIIPKFYGTGLSSKSRFYDFGLKSRDIVMRIVLNPRFRIDESYSDIRDELYRAISSSRTGLIVLHFNSGGTTVARISGFITKFEVPYFTDLPEVQITVTCDDPMFRAINPVDMAPADISDTNPIFIPDSLSTAPHGFTMVIKFLANVTSFVVQDKATDPDWKFTVTPAAAFVANDMLYFSSDYSSKYLYMVKAGVTTHLIDRITPDSVWPIIFPGNTELHFVNLAQIEIQTIEYYAAYWGV